MDIQKEWLWIVHHVWTIISIISDVLLVEVVVKAAAEKRGYKNIVSICDRTADILNFIFDIITGIFTALKNKGASNVEQKNPAPVNDAITNPPTLGDSSKSG